MSEYRPASGETKPIELDTLQLLIQVAEDAFDLISCNCSYDSGTPIAERCDGSCTHGMAKQALKQLERQGLRWLDLHGAVEEER